MILSCVVGFIIGAAAMLTVLALCAAAGRSEPQDPIPHFPPYYVPSVDIRDVVFRDPPGSDRPDAGGA